MNLQQSNNEIMNQLNNKNLPRYATEEPILIYPIEVKVVNAISQDRDQYRENFDRSMRYFRILVQKDGCLSKIREKRYYEKPSVKRRRKRNESRLARLEAEVKMQKMLSGELEKERKEKEKRKELKLQKIRDMQNADSIERYNFI